MKQPPVIAIGLDSADPTLVRDWMEQGRLPNLQRLREQGGYGDLANVDYYKAETPWTTFLTGCLPERTGYWSPIRLVEGSYRVEEVQAYDFREHAPFYALGDGYRVAAFDLPQSTLSDNVNGRQVLGWGAHSPQTPSHSRPQNLLQNITERYGEHPALHRDHGDWWDQAYLQRLHKALDTGMGRRAAICRDWIKEEPWDLFLTIFGETHSASHDFWHISQTSHPLHQQGQGIFSSDPLLDVFEKADRAVGEIIAAAPEDAHVVIFSVHGSGDNVTDVPSMLFLPELLYRFSFPGEMMLAAGKAGARVPPLITRLKNRPWQNEIWNLQHRPNTLNRLLHGRLPRRFHSRIDRWFPNPDPLPTIGSLREQGLAMSWQPNMWYARHWPRMKAFAIPSFSEGYIRINLKDREPAGIVAAEDYDALCSELTRELEALTNPRTGRPVVANVRRIRHSPTDDDPRLPAADLVVSWDGAAADVVDHPRLGRIGPVPYRRSGSHRARGFWIARGPRIAAASTFPAGHAVDLAPTILDLMGAPAPADFDGRSLVAPELRTASEPQVLRSV